MGSDKGGDGGGRRIAKNRKAYYTYEVLEEVEAGMVLKGTEVKSLRDGQVNLGDGHARIEDGQVFLHNVHINPYKLGTHENHDPLRPRKLLLKRREIKKLQKRVGERGLTLVPLALYFNQRGVAKVKLGICRGKKLHDKRRAIAERESQRRIDQAIKHRER